MKLAWFIGTALFFALGANANFVDHLLVESDIETKDLLVSTVFEGETALFQEAHKTYKYEGKSGEVITKIEVKNVLNVEGHVEITDGGLGENFVVMDFRSNGMFTEGFRYVVNIYGCKAGSTCTKKQKKQGIINIQCDMDSKLCKIL